MRKACLGILLIVSLMSFPLLAQDVVNANSLSLGFHETYVEFNGEDVRVYHSDNPSFSKFSNSVIHSVSRRTFDTNGPVNPHHIWALHDNENYGVPVIVHVSRYDDDPSNYLAWGWWIHEYGHYTHHVDGSVSVTNREITIGLFLDGPEIRNSCYCGFRDVSLPFNGVAIYYGRMYGFYQSDKLVGEIQSDAVAAVDFAKGKVYMSECIDCFPDSEGVRLTPVEYDTATGRYVKIGNDYSSNLTISLKQPEFDSYYFDNSFLDSPDRIGLFGGDVVTSNTDSGRDWHGRWHSQFSKIQNEEGFPRLMVATFDAHEGSRGDVSAALGGVLILEFESDQW